MSNKSTDYSAVTEFMLKRRSQLAATLVEPGPSQEDLAVLLRIATRVPDHRKQCPWRFVVYQGEARRSVGVNLARIAEEKEGPLGVNRRQMEEGRFLRAPIVIGVLASYRPESKVPKLEQTLSTGAACMNLLIGANSLGFGAQWITEWYTYDADAARMLGADEHEQFAGFIYIGSSSVTPKERDRPDIEAITTHWTA